MCLLIIFAVCVSYHMFESLALPSVVHRHYRHVMLCSPAAHVSWMLELSYRVFLLVEPTMYYFLRDPANSIYLLARISRPRLKWGFSIGRRCVILNERGPGQCPLHVNLEGKPLGPRQLRGSCPGLQQHSPCLRLDKHLMWIQEGYRLNVLAWIRRDALIVKHAEKG